MHAPSMKILFVCPEVTPFSKTGGLGDVAGALPPALADLGHDVKVVTPLYGSVPRHGISSTRKQLRLGFPFGEQRVELLSARLGDRHEIVFLENAAYFTGRGGIYGEGGGDYGDNHRRFALLSVGALSAAQALGFDADVVQLNDWQCGLGALALRRGFAGTRLARAKSVFTIHNLAYQGIFHKGVMDDLGLPWELFTADSLEYFDAVNFLKGGIAWADAITTVSRRYAQEIQTPELGSNLDGLLRVRRADLYGILNGIDATEWDPSTDPLLPATYSVDRMAGKMACKRELLRRFGLPAPVEGDPVVPLVGVVSRLAAQKGIDLLLDVLPQAIERWGIQAALVGSGDGALEGRMEELRVRYPANVAVYLGFNVELSHLVEAGADFFVMPSRYEPCGLNQMYSLRYGTIPVVRATGGLDDTVADLDEPDPTGIKFGPFHPDSLLNALGRALDLYREPARLNEVRRRGMRQDFSWRASARRYETLFESLLGR